MKTKLVIACIFITLMCSLTSCLDMGAEETIYGKLNSLADEEHSRITVTVVSDHPLGTLENEYRIEYSGASQMEVSYYEEEFSLFEKADDDYILPTEAISYHQGSVSVKNGVIIEQQGEPPIADIKTIGAPKFSFEESFFSGVVSSEGSFSADIENVRGFFGYPIAGTDFVLEVVYGEKLQTLVITYLSLEKYNVQIKYQFQ